MLDSLTRRRLVAAMLTLVASAAVGVLAGAMSGRPFVLTATVFAASTLAPAGALAWLLLVAPVTVRPDRNAGDNVEHRWVQVASAGAFTDLLVVMGLGLAVVSVLDVALEAQVVLLALVVLAMGDAAVRYVALERSAR
ncbi:hypothetical protein FHX52_2844 [Humibacillus xanthopallidus]|uniref:Uncharacterized protein n=1 Tax=Humibacillus xanthopallidus TaxID=412689 RepID=A0A543PPY5_9MICO|nr:hypothetical protein FHX52_2844 [Humibacillus xanthopallidus]